MEIREATLNDRHRGVTGRSVIQAAKEAVPVIDLADRLCGPGGLRRVGKEWVGRCPFPGHEDRVPSFRVNPEKNLCFCHGCARGGDVVHLAAFAWGHDRMDTAAAEVLHVFGHPRPERPVAWFRRQKRQAPVRDGIEEVMARHVQRRLFRVFFLHEIEKIEVPVERQAEKARVWEDLDPIARSIARGRRSS